jgi:hypothetical protein
MILSIVMPSQERHSCNYHSPLNSSFDLRKDTTKALADADHSDNSLVVVILFSANRAAAA